MSAISGPSLALFDFDGTITFDDSFVPFVRSAVDPKRLIFGQLVLGPKIVAYKLGLLPATKIRASIAKFAFRGKNEADVRRLGLAYARDVLPATVRPEAMERIRWHKARGDVVVVVSASLDIYLADWCSRLELDLICTQLEARDGVFTGRYVGGDCTGAKKARRVRERYDIASFSMVFAYGNTREDDELLSLAGKRYYRWEEVS